jgi:PTH1 family peptidyl-tRNA hydrolase
MGLFTQKPQVSDPIQYYTVGLNKTMLLVGLGNVGAKYDHTRHNVGFGCIDYFVNQTEEMGAWTTKESLKCLLSSGRLGQVQAVAIKPSTFMNLSGEAVLATEQFYKASSPNTAVIHDEIDIPFGQIRLRKGGSSAGHNGVKSISQAIGEEYYRIRIGIGPKTPETIDSADFVLQKFNKNEQQQMPLLYREITAILNEFLYSNELPNETRSFLL